MNSIKEVVQQLGKVNKNLADRAKSDRINNINKDIGELRVKQQKLKNQKLDVPKENKQQLASLDDDIKKIADDIKRKGNQIQQIRSGKM